MKWQEVREMFPDQFVLVSILNYHEEGNKKIVDEVAPIRTISEEDVNKEFFQVKPGNLVYHTSNKDFVIHLRRDPLMRVSRYTGLVESIPFYTKIMDRIEIGARSIENIEIDVGILPKDHKGLLGLDILKQQNFIIDLKTLELRI